MSGEEVWGADGSSVHPNGVDVKGLAHSISNIPTSRVFVDLTLCTGAMLCWNRFEHFTSS